MSIYKKTLFTIVTIASPLFILVVLEILLRLFNYRSETDSLVNIKSFQGKKYYCVNTSIAKKYFASRNVGVPEPYEEVFEFTKSPNTYRIFCLGESTMYGYPYPLNVTAPRFLRNYLEKALPDIKFEVINLGIPAVSSSVVLDVLKQVIKYEPNLIIVYAGHNEFYGTYGVASTEYVGYDKTILDVYMKLRQLKFVVLMRECINFMRSIIYADKEKTRKATFLERMVQDRYILYGTSKYNRAKKLFDQNIKEMINIAEKEKINIYFSTLVSNVKDQYPFISLFSPDLETDKHNKWESLFKEGLALEKQGNYTQAINRFTMAKDIDSMRADLHYHIGKSLYSLGKYDYSRMYFKKAKDLDVLRFRATEEFNNIIRSLDTSGNAKIIDLEIAYEKSAINGIPGKELFTEHLHPNVDGYKLMGETFAKAILNQDLGRYKDTLSSKFEYSNQTCDVMYTDLDIESANIRVRILTSSWPFKDDTAGITFIPKNEVQKLAYEYCQREISWEEAHYKMAEYFKRNEQYQMAEKEYCTVARELYLFYHPRMLAGDMKVLQGKHSDAEKDYLMAYELEPNQFVHLRLGTLYFSQNKIDEAIPFLIKALAIDQESKVKFTNQVRLMAFITLGNAYYVKGERTLAIDSYRNARQIDPGNVMVLKMLKQLGAD